MILVVGVGGLGCPAAMALARGGVRQIALCDDDVVERTNLHRQILFGDSDVGTHKLDAAAGALRSIAPGIELRLHRTRLGPRNALDLVGGCDVVLEASDNFQTKFLAADACAIAGVPIVHASAVRWIGTVLAVGARARPCYRCLFEDVPRDHVPNCAEAGVVGPVVGLVGSVQAALAVAMLAGARLGGELVTVDGRACDIRQRTIAPRPDCPLCGSGEPRIRSLDTPGEDPWTRSCASQRPCER